MQFPCRSLPCRSANGLDCVFPIWFTQCGRVWFTHIMPFPCRSANGLDCVFPIWFTQCGRVWFTHAMPLPCRSPAMPRICRSESEFSRPRHRRDMVTAWYVWIGICRPQTAYGRPACVRHCWWMAGSWQGRGKGTAWYVWIRLCSSTLSLTLASDVGGQRHAPAVLPPWKRPGAHCTGGWVGLRAG
jgi:hypothetical protein